MTTQPTLTQLQVEKIEVNHGYAILQIDQILIPTSYNYSLHIIDLEQLNNVIEELYSNVLLFPPLTSQPLESEVKLLQDKLNTLQNGHHTLQKRGLINAIGSINKWISGSMDDEDRQIINRHLETLGRNNRDLKDVINQQVRINENFNSTLRNLLNKIKQDDKIIRETILKENNEYGRKIGLLEVRLRLQEIDRLLNELQDNIILSNFNIIHPSLLTHEEINTYEITADKLKALKVGYSKTDTNNLIFLIKIPYQLTIANKKLIIPSRQINTCLSIDSPITQTIEYENKYYEYDLTKALHQLNLLRHCIFKENCHITKNCKTEIYSIDGGSIIIELADKMKLHSSCDERQFDLNGNYFIQFYNCTINLNNITYQNNIKRIKNKYVFPELIHKTENSTIQFNNIDFESIDNINELKEIKYHRNILYSGTIFCIITIMLVITALLYYQFRHKIIKNKNKDSEIQENPQDNERGVILENIPNNPHSVALF